MDPIMQVQENNNEMYALIRKQREAIDGQAVENIMRTETFSIKSLEAENLKGKMNFGDSFALASHQFDKQIYNREFEKLKKNLNTAEEMIAYFEKLLQIEQNDMEMRLIRASVLGRETVAKRIRAESLGRIRAYRATLLGQYYKLAQKGQQTKRWYELLAEYKRDEAVYQKAAAEFNVRVLTSAALDKVRAERDDTERTGMGNAAALMQEFLAADFSTRTLEAGYVIQNMNACLHNVELIRRMRRMVFTGDDAEKVTRKLEAVSEYANVVESALWEYGLTIDYEALQIREINKNDEAFARKRQAFLENGAGRFYFGVRRYKQSGGNGAEAADARQQGAEQIRVEDKLSALEAKLRISDSVNPNMHIMRASTRSTGAAQVAKTGDVIKASVEEAQGKQEHRKVKERFLNIYTKLKEKLAAKLGEGARAFLDLQTLIDRYVGTNRNVYDNRTRIEQNEANALTALKKALTRVQKNVMNKCSKYAAILLGLLTEENNGYLEVPPGEKHLVEDGNIILKDMILPTRTVELEYRDCTDMPLFTHRPNIKDIAQGGLGDCYLLAGLNAVVDQNAEEIMNIMKDNGDGTVTVCFKREETDASGGKIYTPCYVTVRKTIPVAKTKGGIGGEDAYSRGALWVKMIEKAYTASGFHILDKVNAENAKKGVPQQTYQQLQDDIVKGTRKVNYEEIAGGWTGEFIGLLLGKKGTVHVLDKNRGEHVGNRIGRMLPAVNEPGWKASSDRKFGNESVDSIVYEYIGRQDARLAQDFLELEKSASDYSTKKAEMQKYRRTCILNLDIVDTIAREKGVDMLKLDSGQKIKRWYRKLKAMYAHYYNNWASGSLNDDDEIIARALNHYAAPDFRNRFLKLTVQQFNSTLNILQKRHMELLKKNQQSGRGAAVGNVPQTSQSYYTSRDIKLFERVEKALQSGSYISFDTRKLSANSTGLNGESEEGGMVGTHAYTIINTRRVMVNKQERLYVVVMNPWAEKGVIYDVKADGTRERAVRGIGDREEEEGVFCLDMRRFAEIVKRWHEVPA